MAVLPSFYTPCEQKRTTGNYGLSVIHYLLRVRLASTTNQTHPAFAKNTFAFPAHSGIEISERLISIHLPDFSHLVCNIIHSAVQARRYIVWYVYASILRILFEVHILIFCRLFVNIIVPIGYRY
jgi:hypothetical protein